MDCLGNWRSNMSVAYMENQCSLPSFPFPERRGLANCRREIVAPLRNLITQLARVA